MLRGLVCAAHLPPEQSAAVTVTVTESEVNTRTSPELGLAASFSVIEVSRWFFYRVASARRQRRVSSDATWRRRQWQWHWQGLFDGMEVMILLSCQCW